MECLNCKDYVRIEAKHIVTDIIKNWIDSERPVDWFECLEDVEEFEDLELPEELNATIVSEINQSVVITSIKQQIVISLYYSLPIFGFVISITCLIILVSLGVSQINWLKYNMTMIEWKMYPKKYECPFFEDNIWKHLNIIFGKTWIQKLTPSPIQDSSIYDNDYDEGEKLL